MSTINPPIHPQPTSTHPLVVAMAIFMSGLFAIVLLLVLVTRDGGSSAASTTPEHVHAATAAAATGPAEANPTPAPTVVEPSHHTVAATPAADNHTPYPAELPPLVAGVKTVEMTLKDVTLQVAPGVSFTAWTFAGGAPGPVIHVRQGQKVHVELTNGGAIPHSIDFHAARIAPNRAFKDVKPGETFSFDFTANDPGVFMYHCGTPPVLAHIASGMYGAIVVDPKGGLQPKADRSYVLVGSEWYLNGDGKTTPAGLDMAKARHMQPDFVTWNGFSGQYKTHPLPAKIGENVRFYVVAAGPSFDTAFHVVGTLLDRAWTDGDPHHVLTGAQTVSVPAGGGAIFDTHFDENGLYPFVSHSFASVDMGQVGLVNVGNVKGTMSH
jgi:nitrite reductase (NO-forming)